MFAKSIESFEKIEQTKWISVQNFKLWIIYYMQIENPQEGLEQLLSEGSVHSVNKSFWWFGRYLEENRSGNKPEDSSLASGCEDCGTFIYKGQKERETLKKTKKNPQNR